MGTLTRASRFYSETADRAIRLNAASASAAPAGADPLQQLFEQGFRIPRERPGGARLEGSERGRMGPRGPLRGPRGAVHLRRRSVELLEGCQIRLAGGHGEQAQFLEPLAEELVVRVRGDGALVGFRRLRETA